METRLFIGDFPIETSIHRGLSIAMFDYLKGTTDVSGQQNHWMNKLDSYSEAVYEGLDPNKRRYEPQIVGSR